MTFNIEFRDANNNWLRQKFDSEEQARGMARRLRRCGYKDVELVIRYKQLDLKTQAV